MATDLVLTLGEIIIEAERQGFPKIAMSISRWYLSA
jgi:hypothetical protein